MIMAAAISPDGTSIMTVGRDKTGRIWDRSGNLVRSMNLNLHDKFLGIRFSPVGTTFLTVSQTSNGEIGVLQLRDLTTGNSVGVPMEHSGPVRAVAFSPDGELAFMPSGHTARLGTRLQAGRLDRCSSTRI